jgi:ABC-type branched-subunit amino acid transport system substrate-binding protein
VKKILFGVLIGLVAISMIGGSLVGCSSKSSSSTATTATSTPLTEKVITIGTDSPLTGPAAPWGLSVRDGVTLAAEDFNAAGGLTVGNIHYTFDVESLDDKYDTATTTNNIRQMVDSDGIKYLFTFQTEGTLALGPELSTDKVLSFTVVNDNSVIAQPANSYCYRTYMLPPMEVDGYFKWMTQNHPEAKSLVYITTNNDNGVLLAGLIKQACAKYGITYLDQILYDGGTTDFTPFITKILAENPDIIHFVGAPTGDAALIIKTARDMGYKGILSAGGIVSASDMVGIAGQADLEGVISTDLPLVAPTVSPTILGLPAREDAKWGAHYGSTWDFYSQAWTMFQAIKKADSVDTTAVKAILDDDTQKYDYAAITGGYATFGSPTAIAQFGSDGTHQITNAWTVCIIHNGQDTIASVINP